MFAFCMVREILRRFAPQNDSPAFAFSASGRSGIPGASSLLQEGVILEMTFIWNYTFAE